MRLQRDGTLLWEREGDVTLVDAYVFEDGSVAGYAYPGELVLLFLWPSGVERTRVRLRRLSPGPCGAPVPNVNGFDLRQDPAGVTFWLDDGHVRHFFIDGRESDTAVGTRVESPRMRRPEIVLPTPEQPLELRELARVALLFTPTSPSTRSPIVRLASRTGTITLNEGDNGVLHVFGSDGHLNLLCRPAPSDFVRFKPYEQVDVDPHGNLHAYTLEAQVWFGRHGERLDIEPIESPPGRLGAKHHFLPSGERWRVDFDRLALERGNGEDLVVERSAAGRWFQSLQSAAVSSDGVLAVVDYGNPANARYRDPGTFLQLFEPDGHPRATLPLRMSQYDPPLAAKPGECAVLDVTSRELLVLATDGSYSGRAPMPADPSSLGPITYSPDGSELWLVDRELVLHRLELRWK
jgi:hypothetical protein